MKFRYQKLAIGSHDSRKPLIGRPYIPIYLIGKTAKTRSPYYALLDSGADRTIFPADLAEEVGIANIETGELEPTMGIANQRADVYYHDMALQVAGDSKLCSMQVGFSHQISIPLLGRSFFAHFKGVIFYEGKGEVEFKD
jgi:hypothetical protein